ncbi:SDR family NAD(P)-dependent oxidoreductase [Leeia sp. TBRC 13508]|uniref:SDR family NAD(P)-dependent oxidoreductase n=1 Tax=Leeia speluncae TaxID=2884804 RepID=A0ABS8DCA2_9NEIS|nr:SDR family NAD(P)-dependent oxidoreductase [Leeia speluncae]MCB6185268.1 SDR family NAD(P)-dependent oxidoreductase [Leeia speluncae]
MTNYEAPKDLLKDKVILVTGASTGVGAAVAESAAALGATVILLARRVKWLEKVYDRILAAGGAEPAIMPMDLSVAGEHEFNHAASVVERQLKRLDGIVHCAALDDQLSPMEMDSVDNYVKRLRVNTVAPFALTKAFLPLLKNADNASIILTSESHTAAPQAYWTGNSSTRLAAEHAALGWAQEWERFDNLRVNIVVPGPINSPFRGRTHPGEDRERLPTVASVVPTYLYLLGADSKDVRGQRIQVHGA